MRKSLILLMVFFVLPAMAPVQNQFDFEHGSAFIAGVLGGTTNRAYVDYVFSSAGGDALLATLDSEIFQTRGRDHADHGEEESSDSSRCPGGGSGGCSSGGCGGEEPGGPAGLCLQIINSSGEIVSWADRPLRPGWQRDPKLAFFIPTGSNGQANYVLRVALGDHDCSDMIYPIPNIDQQVLFLLNVSLRRIPPQGPLTRAMALSKNVLNDQGDSAVLSGALGDPLSGNTMDFTFSSRGNEIIFATLNSDIYQTRGRGHSDHGEEGLATVMECPDSGSGGCGGEDPGGGQNQGLAIQVIDSMGAVVAWAVRPQRPGWKRDPRLAFYLPPATGASQNYTLRVCLRDQNSSDLFYPAPVGDNPVTFSLSVSIRKIGPEGNIFMATVESKNRLVQN